jgi:hypothetical protein
VETLRLRRIQNPTHLERLLEALAMRGNLLPAEAYQIRDRGSLPPQLEQLVAGSDRPEEVWACWAHGAQRWLLLAEMSLALSRERGTPVLAVKVYGEDGALQEAATWMPDRDGRWQRCPG